jgi:hypothetical protein
MKKGRYIFLLTVLTVFLFGASQWIPSDKTIPHKQTQKASPEKQKKQVNQAKINRKREHSRKSQEVRVVTLYPAGSISVRKPPTKEKPPVRKVKAQKKRVEAPKKKTKPLKVLAKTTPTKTKPLKLLAKTTPTNTKPPQEKDIPHVSRTYTGERPKLEVGYDYIGFDRYIDVMERVGRLFVLIEDGDKVKLGPEVSLIRRTILGDRGIEKEQYAVDRPHLISDPFIRELLTELDLPETALKDRVVLLFESPFDDLLWDVIASVAAAKNIALGSIMQVSGDYIEKGDGIFLKLTHAVIKDTLKEMPFNRSIRVSL